MPGVAVVGDATAGRCGATDAATGSGFGAVSVGVAVVLSAALTAGAVSGVGVTGVVVSGVTAGVFGVVSSGVTVFGVGEDESKGETVGAPAPEAEELPSVGGTVWGAVSGRAGA